MRDRSVSSLLLSVAVVTCGSPEPPPPSVDPLARAFVAHIAPRFAPESLSARPVAVFTGDAAWDTVVTAELRRLQPAAFAPLADSIYIAGFSTHGFAQRGDTATVRVGWDRCIPPAPRTLFTWWAVHIDYTFARTASHDPQWRYVGQAPALHMDGICELGVHRGPGRRTIGPPAG